MDDYVPPAQYNVFMVDGFMKLILTDLVIHTLACMGHKDRSKHVRLALRGGGGRGGDHGLSHADGDAKLSRGVCPSVRAPDVAPDQLCHGLQLHS